MKRTTWPLFSVLVAVSSSTAFAAGLDMPAVFSDHMILQRDSVAPLWGSAAPGETVSVSFRDREKSTTADAETGAWQIDLNDLKPGEPGTVKVTGSESDRTLTFSNVLVGDVWVGSGQSNMAGKVSSYARNDFTLAKARDGGPYENIRLFHIGKPPGAWQVATPETIDGFSALLFAFGQALNRDLDVPIGLMLGAVGGTPSGLWLSEEALSSDAAVQAEIAKFAAGYDHDAAMKSYEEVTLPKWQKAVERLKAKAEANPAPSGKKLRLPRKPPPPAEPGNSTRGGKLGGLYGRYIQPAIGYGIRGVLWDQGESGSGIRGASQFGTMRALIAGWRREWNQGEFPFLFVQKPSGGGCAFRDEDPVTREADEFSPLPQAPPNGGGEQRWEYVRLMNATPAAYMVGASDLGGMVHPINKWAYGQRSALAARGAAYKEKGLVWSGPAWRDHSLEDGGKVRISFDHTGSGLKLAHADQLQGFELAGQDGKFTWADAVIDGDQVVVSSPNIPKPKAVRYGYSKVRPWANLFNAEGLPALVFSVEVD